MRFRVFAVLFLAGAVTVTLSLLRGQDRTPQTAPASHVTTVTPSPAKPAATGDLNDFQKAVQQSARSGSEWLHRMNNGKGKFVESQRPALAKELFRDRYVCQLHAALSLARAARVTGEEHFAARATQAVLTALTEVGACEGDEKCHCVNLPGFVANRLGATGLLVAAINELPAPQKDLLDRSELMCNYLRKQARADGALTYHDGKGETDGIDEHPGAALYGIALSQRHRPAAWKSDLLKKALPHYRAHFKKSHSTAFVPMMVAAFAEAHATSKDKAHADFVFEMVDWLCGLQYVRVERDQLVWHGGFRGWQNGQAVETTPTAADAGCAEALALGCRCARAEGDAERHGRYKDAAGHAARFLMTLQYRTESANHFAEWYRPRVLGGFHHSHEDGNLAVEQTGHAVTALLSCLEHAR